jgi:hypothetical protein
MLTKWCLVWRTPIPKLCMAFLKTSCPLPERLYNHGKIKEKSRGYF